MKHPEIYINFLVEYDKLSAPNSYPSLTKKEVCIMLNKAYLALIAQKLTGNNPRAVQFESDNKAIEDIRPLITTSIINRETDNPNANVYASNAILYEIPQESLYYIQSSIKLNYKVDEIGISETGRVEVKLVTHETAQKYMYTIHNKPWIESPVCYIENKNIVVLVDERHLGKDSNQPIWQMYLTYVKDPIRFSPDTIDKESDIEFELSDTVAQELINLAIVMSAETVESPRTTTKLNLRPLES